MTMRLARPFGGLGADRPCSTASANPSRPLESRVGQQDVHGQGRCRGNPTSPCSSRYRPGDSPYCHNVDAGERFTSASAPPVDRAGQHRGLQLDLPGPDVGQLVRHLELGGRSGVVLLRCRDGILDLRAARSIRRRLQRGGHQRGQRVERGRRAPHPRQRDRAADRRVVALLPGHRVVLGRRTTRQLLASGRARRPQAREYLGIGRTGGEEVVVAVAGGVVGMVGHRVQHLQRHVEAVVEVDHRRLACALAGGGADAARRPTPRWTSASAGGAGSATAPAVRGKPIPSNGGPPLVALIVVRLHLPARPCRHRWCSTA